ncbi:hypothetical protein D3C81_1653680 [compost metagenome]
MFGAEPDVHGDRGMEFFVADVRCDACPGLPGKLDGARDGLVRELGSVNRQEYVLEHNPESENESGSSRSIVRSHGAASTLR